MALQQLLAARLSPPPLPAALIERADLQARLDQAAARLLLVVAPAGFGKTTLVASWLSQAQSAKRKAQSELGSADPLERSNAQTLERFAWLSLDARDNDPTRFWGALLAALSRAVPGLGDHARAMLQSPTPPAIEVVIAALLDDLAALSAPCLLVIDDYHVIAEPAIHAALAELIEHLPATSRVAILSRSEPPLPLARLRLRGQLAELRAGDMRFSPSEAAAFLRAHGLALGPADVSALAERAEGWAGALQLAAISLRESEDPRRMIAAFAGSNRHLVDYLAEEVFARQPADRRRFLLATCLLDPLCAELCDALAPPPAPRSLSGSGGFDSPPPLRGRGWGWGPPG